MVTASFFVANEFRIIQSLKEHFLREGYLFLEPYTTDFGFDLILVKNNEYIAIEIKKSPKIHRNTIHHLIGKRDQLKRHIQIYLCIPEKAELLYGSKKIINQHNIGIITYDSNYKISIKQKVKNAEDFILYNMRARAPNILETLIKEPKKDVIIYEKKISRILLDLIPTIDILEYSDILNNFKKEYEKTKNVENEHVTILKTLKELWSNFYGKPSSAKSFEFFDEFEPILKRIKYYRDHFIHSFQVFLLGSIIIDQYYEVFSQFYRNKMNRCDPNSIDLSWMLASTFHDFCYPISKYDDFNVDFFKHFLECEKNPITMDLQNNLLYADNLKYIDQLSSIYHHYYSSSNKDWIYNNPCVINEDIRKKVILHYTQGDHGVLSSITLINKILKESFVKNNYDEYIQNKFSTDIYPAALSISMHNNLYKEFEEKININSDPLTFLLVYCDTIQDWGRLENNNDYLLNKFMINDNNINAIITYINTNNYKRKETEIKKVFNYLVSDSLCFKIQIRNKGSEYSESTCPSL